MGALSTFPNGRRSGQADLDAEEFSDGSGNFLIFGMASGLELRVDKIVIDRNFEFAASIGDEGHRELLRKLLKELGSHAHGTVCVISSPAEDDRYDHSGAA